MFRQMMKFWTRQEAVVVQFIIVLELAAWALTTKRS